MQDTAKAVYGFFSGFGIPAYAQDAVPDDAELPYITYYLQEPEWSRQASGYAQVWYPSRNRAKLNELTDMIVREIGSEGTLLGCDNGGYVMIRPETPLVSPAASGEDKTIGNLVNFILNAYHMPGM